MTEYYVILGTGHRRPGEKDYSSFDQRLSLRDYIGETLNKIPIIPEDIDALNKEDKVKKLEELDIKDYNKDALENSIDLTELLVRHSTLTFNYITTKGPISEFGQFYKDPKIKDQLIIFNPIDKIGDKSILTAQIEKFIFTSGGHGFFYRDFEDVKYYAERCIHYNQFTKKIDEELISIIDSIFYDKIAIKSVLFFTIPYDKQMLKKIRDIKKIVEKLEQSKDLDLSKLILTKEIQYHEEHQRERQLTKYEFENSIHCKICDRHLGLTVRIFSNGVIEYYNKYLSHYVRRQHSFELKIDEILQALNDFILFAKKIYDEYNINEFLLGFNIIKLREVKKIKNLSRTLPLFSKDASFRLNIKVKEDLKKIFEEVFNKIKEKLLKSINKTMITKKSISSLLQR